MSNSLVSGMRFLERASKNISGGSRVGPLPHSLPKEAMMDDGLRTLGLCMPRKKNQGIVRILT